MKNKSLEVCSSSLISSPAGRGRGEGAALPHEQTIAGNVAEILEA